MPTETIISQVRKKEAFKGLDKIGKFNYNSTRWRKVASLHKKLNPICSVEGCTNPVHTTDHIVPILKGGAKLDFSNLQSLCRRHNAIKTAKDGKSKKD
jgi:5-methylcytosine-specific restriction endonuclease McrA